MKRPIVWCCSAFICGTILYFRFSVFLLILFTGCIIYTAYTYKRLSFLILFPVLLAGILPPYIYEKTHLEPISRFENADISFRVIDTHRYKSSGGYKCYLVKTMPSKSFPLEADGYIYTFSDYKPEQLVTAECTVFPATDDDDYGINLINKELEFTAVSYSGRVTGKHDCRLLCRIRLFRNSVVSEIENSLSPKNAGFLSAILTGDKDLLTDYRSDTFRKSGISHIMAVSGFHVSALLGFLYVFLNLFHIKGILKNILCTLFLLFLIPFMNFSPSAIRAVIMGIVLLWSSTLRRDTDSLSSLSLAAIIILCYRPYSLMDLSFILSFTATAGIILISPLFKNIFAKRFGTELKNLSSILAVHISLIPSNIYYFGTLSLISIPANLLFVPLFPFIMFMLIITVAFGRLVPQLCKILNFTTDIFLGAVENYSMLPVNPVNISFSGESAFALIVTAALTAAFKNKLRFMFGFLSLLLAVSIGIGAFKTAFGNRIFMMSDENLYATVVSTPEKTLASVDFGDDADYYDFSDFSSTLREKGIKKIDFFYIINYNDKEEYFKSLIKNTYNSEFLTEGAVALGKNVNVSVSDWELEVNGNFPVLKLSKTQESNSRYLITGKHGKAQLKLNFKDNRTENFRNSVIEIGFNDEKITEIKQK